MKVLVDTNVLLNRFLIRDSYYQSAREVIDLCAKKQIEGFIAANSVLNIFYIVRKEIPERKRRKLLLSLYEIMEIVSVDDLKLKDALEYSAFSDFEDCIQYLCAKEVDADYIITRNIKDFAKSDIPVIAPDDFLELLT